MDYKHLYEVEKKSIPKIVELLESQGVVKSVGYVYNRLIEAGVTLRSSSEAACIVHDSLDYSKSFLTYDSVSHIDGFLLGDGYIFPNHSSKVGRATCSLQHKEFCEYMMSGLQDYNPSPPAFNKNTNGKGDGCWYSYTKFHPDLYKQYQRWYKDGFKRVPKDVRLDSISILLWYLGDGSVVVDSVPNTLSIRFSTDGFLKEDVVFLASKMRSMGISSHRNGDNRVYVEAKGIPSLFEVMAKESPVDCYKYKFDKIPKWRFSSKRMKDVATELHVDYNRLAHLVKTGQAPCYRASKKGRPRFLPEHISVLKDLKSKGDLY